MINGCDDGEYSVSDLHIEWDGSENFILQWDVRENVTENEKKYGLA